MTDDTGLASGCGLVNRTALLLLVEVEGADAPPAPLEPGERFDGRPWPDGTVLRLLEAASRAPVMRVRLGPQPPLELAPLDLPRRLPGIAGSVGELACLNRTQSLLALRWARHGKDEGIGIDPGQLIVIADLEPGALVHALDGRTLEAVACHLFTGSDRFNIRERTRTRPPAAD